MSQTLDASLAETARPARVQALALPVAALVVAAGHVLLHLVTTPGYGIFRDELYYLACADHLAWGYVDHPPLSIAVLWAVRALLGDSLLVLRLVPALAGGLLVLLSARLARELGGGRFAATLAAVSVAVVPQILGLTGVYSMNALDLLFWAGLAFTVVRLVRTDEPRLWLAFGGLAGLGLLNKISVLFFCAGIGVALLVTPLRRHLRTPWPWLGGALALLVFAPHLVWQVVHDWPTAEFIRNAQEQKMVALSPLAFLAAHLRDSHPLNVPLLLGGLAFLLADREGRRFRPLGIAYLVALAVLLAQRSKPYYLAPAVPMLLAAGCVAAEGLLSRLRTAWPRTLVVVVLLAGGALTVPFAVPLLSVETFVAYQRALGAAPGTDEKHDLGALPQYYADRFGWEEIAEAVARVHASLPAEERSRAAVVTGNYGEAGAIDYFGRRLGLPRASSVHNTYWLWGPSPEDPAVVLTVGISEEGLRQFFESVTPAARLASRYAMPYENEHPITVCRGLKVPLADLWPRVKHFQ